MYACKVFYSFRDIWCNMGLMNWCLRWGGRRGGGGGGGGGGGVWQSLLLWSSLLVVVMKGYSLKLSMKYIKGALCQTLFVLYNRYAKENFKCTSPSVHVWLVEKTLGFNYMYIGLGFPNFWKYLCCYKLFYLNIGFKM